MVVIGVLNAIKMYKVNYLKPKKKGYAKHTASFMKIEDAIFWEQHVSIPVCMHACMYVCILKQRLHKSLGIAKVCTLVSKYACMYVYLYASKTCPQARTDIYTNLW